MTTGQIALVMLGVLLFLGGLLACVVSTHIACEQTRRAALTSTEPARSLAIAQRCFAGV